MLLVIWQASAPRAGPFTIKAAIGAAIVIVVLCEEAVRPVPAGKVPLIVKVGGAGTAVGVSVAVPEVAPAAIVMVAGAMDALGGVVAGATVSATVAPPAGAAPLNVAVICAAPQPVVVGGVTVSDINVTPVTGGGVGPVWPFPPPPHPTTTLHKTATPTMLARSCRCPTMAFSFTGFLRGG